MDGFEYIRRANEYYQPRTPMTALRAVRAGFLPVPAYVYKAGSVKPLHEAPYDLEEIDRILSRTDNDIKTNIQLKSIFSELLQDRDPEVALYAAESINMIENRYNRRIEDLKSRLDEADHADGEEKAPILGELTRLYYELALFNQERTAIKNFYLREAFDYVRQLEQSPSARVEDKELMVRILQKLELFSQAAFVIKGMQGDKADAELILLEAENEFLRQDFAAAIRLIVGLEGRRSMLNEIESQVFSFWTGSAEEKAGTSDLIYRQPEAGNSGSETT